MKIRELYRKMEERLPRTLSCAWDHDGLMVAPDEEREIRRAAVALDVTDEVIAAAEAAGCDLIVSHHPLLFSPLPAVEAGDPIGARVLRLIRAGVGVMSFHTRLDAARGGVNDTLAAKLGLSETVPFGADGEEIGRIGTIERPTPLAEFAARVAKILCVPAVEVADAGKPVHRVAVLGGSGSDDVAAARASGADTFVTGELKYHQFVDAPEEGINLIAAGHYHTEFPVCEVLARMLGEIDPTIEVRIFPSNRIRLIGERGEL